MKIYESVTTKNMVRCCSPVSVYLRRQNIFSRHLKMVSNVDVMIFMFSE